MLDGLEKKIRELLPSYTHRFFNEAERALKANRIDDAVEAYICYWTSFRGKLNSAQSERISEIVKRETGFDLVKHGVGILTMAVTAPTAFP